ncbi:hypothetical protein C1Y63_09085 [Corynebacterium sp. 13CS0277]|uniref:DUF3024 domain-containing protein n=1 Tax=Corynebacterium sp. 13CS0277 TaxID=2071994 RepID=UPI000D0310AC|nr:DUF3024 domain-containing protein [Corynebacterium sp. 13CS0277]PRQ10887.1 hypothetical protein C1Y63_09085 [Corynebacterium sp. 13CS0277]
MHIPGELRYPKKDLTTVEKWARNLVPKRIQDQLRIEVDHDDDTITVFECRPPWHPTESDTGPWIRQGVAQFHFDWLGGKWALFWFDQDSNLHPCTTVNFSSDIGRLVEYLDSGDNPIFWG